MIKHLSALLILLTIICSCSDNTNDSNNVPYSDKYSGVTIHTSGPRGGGYTDSTGKIFGYRIFRTRVINDTIIPIELTIKFPIDSVVMLPKSHRHLRVFVIPDTLTPDTDKQYEYNYGVTELKSFLKLAFNKSTMLKVTIQPKQYNYIYLVVLCYPAPGLTNAKLFINGQDENSAFIPIKSQKTIIKSGDKLDLLLGLRIIDPPITYSLIPCGQIVFKN